MDCGRKIIKLWTVAEKQDKQYNYGLWQKNRINNKTMDCGRKIG